MLWPVLALVSVQAQYFADPVCPCINPWTDPNWPAGNYTTWPNWDATKNCAEVEDNFCIASKYGASTCEPWDLTLDPACLASDPATFCPASW